MLLKRDASQPGPAVLPLECTHAAKTIKVAASWLLDRLPSRISLGLNRHHKETVPFDGIPAAIRRNPFTES
jgi:hypothetical protein